MTLKFRSIIIVAIFAAFISTYGIYKYLQKQKDEIQKPKFPTRQVLVAQKNLSIGDKITESNVNTKDWPEDIIPKGFYSDVNSVIDRIIKTEIYEGEAILESKLAPIGSEGGFSSIIPPGMRALTVSVDTYSGVSGFILPNTRVDVLVTIPSYQKKEESSTKIILENVKVLAVDQLYERKGDDPVIVQSVTLLVTPEEAEKLVLASTEGKLQLSLRNTADKLENVTTGVKLKELIPRETARRVTRRSTPRRAQTPSVSEPEEQIIEIIRSSEREEVKIEKKTSEEKKTE